VKKILEEFRGAKIETAIRKKLKKIEEEEPYIEGDVITFDEEE
jgi:hypothetical protein